MRSSSATSAASTDRGSSPATSGRPSGAIRRSSSPPTSSSSTSTTGRASPPDGPWDDARMAVPATVDEYLASLSDDERAALESMRATVNAAAPDADESIAYGMPALRSHGRQFLV